MIPAPPPTCELLLHTGHVIQTTTMWTGRGKPPNWINGKDWGPVLIEAAQG